MESRNGDNGKRQSFRLALAREGDVWGGVLKAQSVGWATPPRVSESEMG